MAFFTPALKSRLHPGYSHPVLVGWQVDSTTITASNLVFPIFLSDKPDAKEEIKAMPGQVILFCFIFILFWVF